MTNTTTPTSILTDTPTTASSQAPVAGGGSPKLLRGFLYENVAFSIASGLVFALGASRLDTWAGVNTWLLVALGVGLIGYADLLFLGARRDDTLVMTGRSAVIGDLGWIAGAIAIIAATDWLTRNGEIALAVISIPVAILAAGQYVGLRRIEG